MSSTPHRAPDAPREAFGRPSGACSAPAPARLPDQSATALLAQGQVDQALDMLAGQAASQPGQAQAQNDLGVTMLLAGRAPDALAPLRRAVELDAGSGLFRCNLAKALMANQQWREALGFLEQVSAHLDHENPAEVEALLEVCRRRMPVPPVQQEDPLLAQERAKFAHWAQSLSFKSFETVVAPLNLEAIETLGQGDPWLRNYALNVHEYQQGATRLASLPWNVTIPIVDYCNASCVFCTSWFSGIGHLRIEEMERMRPLLASARQLGLQGHGEPTAHPHFEEILLRLREILDPRCEVYIISNGVLLGRYLEALRSINVKSFNLSLNAASPATHNEVMGMGLRAFDRVCETIRRLVRLREQEDPGITIHLSFVVVNQNLAEAGAFIRLANELGVNSAILRTLSPQEGLNQRLNYHTLPAYRHPNFESLRQEAAAEMARSQVAVQGSPESWAAPIFSPELEEQIRRDPPALVSRAEARQWARQRRQQEGLPQPCTGKGAPLANHRQILARSAQDGGNPYERQPRYGCHFPYYNLNLTSFNYQIVPCCYMGQVPGFEPLGFGGENHLQELWNSPALLELRRSLGEGPLLKHCRRCPPVF